MKRVLAAAMALVVVTLVTSFPVQAQSWVQVPPTSTLNYYGCAFDPADANKGVIGGFIFQGSTYYPFACTTADGGVSMAYHDLYLNGSFLRAKTVAFPASNAGYVSGAGVMKTVDGGDTWTLSMNATTANGFFQDMYFADADTGFVIGETWPNAGYYEGQLFKTDDGGAHWYHHTVSNIFNSGSTLLTCMARPAPRLIYVGAYWGAGNEKTFFKSTDDGSSWTVSNIYTTFLSLAFTSPTTGYAGTLNGILKTVDGGTTWGQILSGTGQVNSIRFLGDHGFAVTSNGSIYESVNGGASWASMFSPVQGTAVLTSVFLHPSGPAYAVGFNGTVLRYDSPAGMVDGAIPQKLELGQNQPNPFRLASRFQLRLPEAQEANVRLYDAQGRLVRVLLEGTQPAGSREVVVNGGDLPAGTYFYRLQAGSLTESRKLTIQR